MTESNDQSNSYQGTPRKQKSSIKSIIHNFFKPGIETQLHIKNMKLNDIPTQATPVFIHIRQGREKLDTQAVKIIDNTAVWQDEVVIDSRVPSFDTQPRSQDNSNNSSNNNNNNNNANNSSPQQSNTTAQRPSSMSNIHDYDNYDNYDNYEYEQPEENDNLAANTNIEQQAATSAVVPTTSSKSQERSERRKERKERRELEKREKKEKKEKERREKRENKEKEKKEKRERKPQNSNKNGSSSSFCLEFTFRLEDVSGRSSTIYGKTVLDLVQITSATDWEYRAVLHECNYETRFSCLISVGTKKQRSSNMDTLPPLPVPNLNNNSNSNGNNSTQAGAALPPKIPSALSTKSEKGTIYRNNCKRERSFTEQPTRRIPIHESASFDGISEIIAKECNIDMTENTDNDNDNFYFEEFTSSEIVPSGPSRRAKRNNTLSANSIKNNTNSNESNNKKSFSISRSHSHLKSHGHRKNENLDKNIASTMYIPLDQNGISSRDESDDEFEDKLPFKVQRDKLERLSDQVESIINFAFYGSPED